MLIKNISMGESECFFNVNVACLTGVQTERGRGRDRTVVLIERKYLDEKRNLTLKNRPFPHGFQSLVSKTVYSSFHLITIMY